MRKFFMLFSLLLVASLVLDGNVFAKGKRVDDEESSSSMRMGFGLDGINTSAGPISAASVRWDMGKVQFDALLGFNSTSFTGGSSSTFGLGGQFGYVLKSTDNLNIKFLGRLTFANVAPSVGTSASTFGVGVGLGGEFFIPGIPNVGIEGGVLLGFLSTSVSGASTTTFGFNSLDPVNTPGLAIHYYF